MSTSKIIVAVVAVVVLAAVGALAITEVDYSTCTDTLLCAADTCTTAEVPAMMCINAGNKSAPKQQMLLCDPNVRACAEIWTFSDPHCRVPLKSEAVTCNECTEFSNNKIECQSRNGIETLIIKHCADDQCSKDCKAAVSLTKGQCFQTKSKTGQIQWIKYDGAALCTMADQVLWNGAQCSGTPTYVQQLPTDRCINGNLVHCKYDTNATTAVSAARQAGAACKRSDVRLAQCALSVQRCRAACGAGAQQCARCIRETLAGDRRLPSPAAVRQCCRALSYYAGFDCAECDASIKH